MKKTIISLLTLSKKHLILSFIFIVIVLIGVSLLVSNSYKQNDKTISLDNIIEPELNNDNISKPVSNNNTIKNSVELLKEEYSAIEIPANQTIINIEDDENIIVVSDDRKQIQRYNVNTKTTSTISEVYDSNNYIKTIVCNDQWYVWVEDEDLITDYSVKPFKWIIIAYNIETKEKINIDASNFNHNNYDVPLFITYTPYKLNLSSNNKIVFCKNVDLNGTVGSQVIFHDLDSGKQNIVDESTDVRKTYITDCAIYNNTALYCKFYELNDDFSYRQTQYKYSDLFQYNYGEDKSVQLTSNDFYCDPSIYKDKIVVVRIPAGESKYSCYAELGIFEASIKQYKSLVNRRTIYKITGKAIDDIYVNGPKILDNMLMWKDTGIQIRFIYSLKDNKYMEMIKDKPGYIINITDIFKNYLTFAVVNKVTCEAKCYFIKLDNN